jgi:EAL domain-containing protein (putative c-di-GMP-specific phosphodiesterase class I)/ActR/RegA family two-component response regulator
MQVSDLNFLVVEDNDFQRHWLKVMLNNIGATNVYQASDGQQALQILKEKKNRIDISFIDLNLPGMDGMELIRHMSKQERAPSIVLASALAPSLIFSVKTMSKAYGVNLLGAIEKPATPDTILNLVDLHRSLPTADKLDDIPHICIDEIRHGLLNDQFEPFFQPKVELTSGKITGVEAFARWRHPEYGVLPPASFLGPLQDANEIIRLDLLIFKKVLDAFQNLQKHEPEITVSVNTSAISCADPAFVENILAYASGRKIESKKISFEISESAAVRNAPNFLENLVRLRMKGFGISIDEYGTAHSNVQHLLRIPFSELKIDRSMILGPKDNPSLEIALDLSIELCRRLDCHSVAVGVETKQDWDLLQKLECEYAQGFYIAHPMEEDALALWMKEWAHFF